jgi:riboflavin biosynthesis pyrimidine reductase
MFHLNEPIFKSCKYLLALFVNNLVIYVMPYLIGKRGNLNLQKIKISYGLKFNHEDFLA